ncbi:MAG: ribose-5-phosphate isomerase RpiA [Thermoplasmata archaeon]
MLVEKRNAGLRAVEYVEDGMVVGLGTGSTTKHAIDALADRIRDEGLEIVGIPTSISTEEQAMELNIPLSTLEEHEVIDLTIDGADEVDPNMNLIKGGGGALLREKLIALNSKSVIIIVDRSKLVDQLGLNFHLPVEVLPYCPNTTMRMLEELDCGSNLRMHNSSVFKTDNYNYIIDCNFRGIDRPGILSTKLNKIPTVVENGLFVNVADKVIVGKKEEVEEWVIE